MHIAEAVLGVVVLALLVGALAGRLRTPAASLLVLAGLGLGFLPGLPAVRVSPNLLLLGVLPPLLFSAAQQLSLLDLRSVWRPVAGLSSLLVLASAGAVALVAHALDPELSYAVAFVLGTILASTDPVAVTALSRELRLPARVATMVQAESLFNDATSLVLFEVAIAAATTGELGAGRVALSFVRLGAGGAALGMAVGVVAAAALRRAGEPSLQASVAVVTPFVAAVLAASLGLSPVTSVIVAGLVLGRRPGPARTPGGRLAAAGVYEVLVFLTESAVFALIGLELGRFLRELPTGQLLTAAELLGVIAATLLLVRGAALLPNLLARRPEHRGTGGWQVAAVLTWAGARGAIPLVAALSIPATTRTGRPFPAHALLLVVAAGVVVATLIVQGSTLSPLVRRLRVAAAPEQLSNELLAARRALAMVGLDRLAELGEVAGADPASIQRLRADLQGTLARTERFARREVDPGSGSGRPGAGLRLRQRVLVVQAEELDRLRLAGELSHESFRHLQRELDLEHARLRQQGQPSR